jgi:hypothetical protein
MKNEKNDYFVLDDDEFFQKENPSLVIRTSRSVSLVNHIDAALENALAQISNLTPEMTNQCGPGWPASCELCLDGSVTVNTSQVNPPESEKWHEMRLGGFSGYAFRHLMNNLGSGLVKNYLEIGTFRGSSLISTVYGNEDSLNEIHAIDNFSEFVRGPDHPQGEYDPKADLEWNLSRFLPDTKNRIQFHEEDCWEFDLKKLPKIDLYFYDGYHSAECQYKAFKYFEPVFADCFISVVDDWEQPQVRKGTRRAYSEIGYDVIASRAVIPARRPAGINSVESPSGDWWLGVHVSVLKKRGI